MLLQNRGVAGPDCWTATPREGGGGSPGEVMKDQLDVAWLMELAEQRYIEQNLPEAGGSSIVQVYRKVKEGYGYENYLTDIKNSRLRVVLSNFRVGNHKLQNQLARWHKKAADLDAMKVCKAYSATTEDEEHLLMHCSAYNRVRQK